MKDHKGRIAGAPAYKVRARFGGSAGVKAWAEAAAGVPSVRSVLDGTGEGAGVSAPTPPWLDQAPGAPGGGAAA